MTIVRLVALAALNIAYLWFLDRRDGRDRSERAAMLQRIQAPQAAVYEHHAAVTSQDQPSSPLPMSDAEMAAMQQAPSQGQTMDQIIAELEADELRKSGFYQPEDGLLA